MVYVSSNDSTVMRAFRARSPKHYGIDTLKFLAMRSRFSVSMAFEALGGSALLLPLVSSHSAYTEHLQLSDAYPSHIEMLCFKSEAEDLITHLAYATRFLPSQLHQIILGRIDKSRWTTQQHLVVF